MSFPEREKAFKGDASRDLIFAGNQRQGVKGSAPGQQAGMPYFAPNLEQIVIGLEERDGGERSAPSGEPMNYRAAET